MCVEKNMKYDLSILARSCDELKIDLTEIKKEQFFQYFELLIEWNKVMNLTGITEFEEVLLKHFVDSLAIAKAVDMNQVYTMIDVGTGAGFPGIPIKIVFPHIKVTLLDSLNKRIKFLNEVIDQLRLKDITAVHGRAEDIARSAEHRDFYDLSVSRAVSKLSSLTEYCLPYVKPKGCFISYKSGQIQDELEEAKKAIDTLGGNVKSVVPFTLLDSDIERTLIVIEKIKKTPKKYPRKAGVPAKEPI